MIYVLSIFVEVHSIRCSGGLKQGVFFRAPRHVVSVGFQHKFSIVLEYNYHYSASIKTATLDLSQLLDPECVSASEELQIP